MLACDVYLHNIAHVDLLEHQMVYKRKKKPVKVVVRGCNVVFRHTIFEKCYNVHFPLLHLVKAVESDLYI
jgi:hypothetical protein